MNRPANENRDAADWFAARRRGVMSVDERRGLDVWLASPANRQAMREMDRVWTILGGTATTAAAIAAPAQGRMTMLAVMCAASVALCALSLGVESPFWTTLDWNSR